MTDLQPPANEIGHAAAEPSIPLAILHVAAILVFWKGLEWGTQSGLGLLIGLVSAWGLLASLISTLVFAALAVSRSMKRRRAQQAYLPGPLAWTFAFAFGCAFLAYASGK